MSPTALLGIFVLSMLGATAQGSIGVGYALMAGAGLVAIDPAFVPGPLLIIGMVVACRHLIVERSHIDVAAWKRCMFGLPIGLGAGLLVLNAMNDRALSLAVGAATVLAALSLLAGVSVSRTPRVEVVAGAATAFAAVTASLPGPPFLVAFSDLRPAALRGTSTSVILVVTMTGFLGLVLTNNFGRDELELLALLVPGTFTGLLASRWVRPHLEANWFRPLILTLAAIGGAALVLRNL